MGSFLSLFQRAAFVSSLLALASCFFCDRAQAQMPPLTALKGTGDLAPSPDAAKFIFIAGGDNRPASAGCPQNGVPQTIFAQVQATGASFVIWSGDTIFGKQVDEPAIKNQYAEFLRIAKTAGVPVFNAPGNHELDDQHNRPNDDMKKWYEQATGAPVYGAFNYGNSRFIALDSENPTPTPAPGAEAKTDPPPDGKKKKEEAPGHITQEQRDLLEKDLEANRDKAHIFIFMHHPVKPAKAKDGLDQDSVAYLEGLFKNYNNVSYVISGHEHLYYNPQGNPPATAPPPGRTDPSQPPDYLVAGGGGAPLEKDFPDAFYHYLVFTVDGNKVSPVLVRVDATPSPCAKEKDH